MDDGKDHTGKKVYSLKVIRLKKHFKPNQHFVDVGKFRLISKFYSLFDC